MFYEYMAYMLGGVRPNRDILWVCPRNLNAGASDHKYFVENTLGFNFGRWGKYTQHASRMIFTMPELSPGSAVGVRMAQDRVGSSLHVIPISAAATAADMFQPNECDPESVTAARVQVLHILHCWLESSWGCNNTAPLHRWQLPDIDWHDFASTLSTNTHSAAECPYLYNAYPWGVDYTRLLPLSPPPHQETVEEDQDNMLIVLLFVALLLFICLIVAVMDCYIKDCLRISVPIRLAMAFGQYISQRRRSRAGVGDSEL